MNSNELQTLVRKYLKGECTAQEKELIENWYEGMVDADLHLTASEKEEVKTRMLHAIQQEISPASVTPAIRIPFWNRMVRMAAVFILLIAVAYALVPSDVLIGKNTHTEKTIHINNANQAERIKLPDGSIALLEPGSELSFLIRKKDKKREVWLKGEAFFEVVKDAGRPFFVYGNQVVTKVLGTSFSVKARPDAKTVEVEVKTGRVSVYEIQKMQAKEQHTDGQKEIVLKPNQKVVYHIVKRHWETALVKEPAILNTKETEKPLFKFDNTPLPEIMTQLEKNYGIDFVLENDAVSTCTFTGDISGLPLHDMLAVISRSIGATYSVKKMQIIIQGPGCDNDLNKD